MQDASRDRPYWNRPARALMEDFGVQATGLTSAQARDRLERHGRNAVKDDVRLTPLKLLFRQFASPLVQILIVGAIISLLVRQWIDAWIILMVVFGSALLGFSQEYRASTAVAELRRRLALTARVLRDGGVTIMPADAIVPGDVVTLSAGNLVPADGLVIEAKDFLVTEASLTGESFPVEKRPGVVPNDAPLASRTNCVFLGTSVRSGTATVLIVKTGRNTAFGAIADRLQVRAPETEFERGIRQFGYLLLRVMVVIVLFVLTINLLLHRPVIDSVLFAVALSVGLSPELLPAIVSVTLSAGARAMAQRGVIIRRLEAIENLGSIDILCTDKTGTLTEGVVALKGAVDPDGRDSVEVARISHLNSAFETGIDNPLDAAIIATGAQRGLSTAGFHKIDEIPYDFLRKRLTIVTAEDRDPATHTIITKGAFASVVATCTRIVRKDAEVPLDDATRLRLDAYYRDQSSQGFRVLAVAQKHVPEKSRYGHEDEEGMTFAGFLLFFDPPKQGVQQAIHDLATLGIRTKIITGDNRFVTARLAETIGLKRRTLLTGEEITRLTDEALWHLAENIDLFVEVDPQQKERLVHAMQRTGHTVGFLGDGINDAAALHAADVGISVDQAVDVARESADIVLLRRDLSVLKSGVESGRRTFANTLKYICITTSANFGNMISMALATPFLPFLPLAAKQILLNNFLSDLPSVTISTDHVDSARIKQAQHWSIHDIQVFMIVFGLISTAFDFLTFFVLLRAFTANEATFQTAWFVVSLLTEIVVVLVLRTQLSVFRSRPGPLLLAMTIGVGAGTLVIPYADLFTKVFNFVPLPAPLLGTLLLIVAGYIAATEFAKFWFFRRRARMHKRNQS